MMKKILQTALLFFLVQSVVLGNVFAERLQVAASIFPLGDIVRQIGGDRVDVLILLARNASPHVYEPTTKDIIRLQESKAFFLIGLQLEPWAEKLVGDREQSQIKLIKTGNIVLNYNEEKEGHVHEEDEGEDGRHHGGVNPHIWLAPDYALKMAEVVLRELTALQPESKEYFEGNYRKFSGEIAVLKKEMGQLRNKIGGKDIRVLTFHNAFTYFFAELGLAKLKSIEPFPGKKPSVRKLKEVVDFMSGGEMKAVFTEPQFSGKMLENIASETGAKKGILDPNGYYGIPERDGYFSLMRYNLRQVDAVCR